MIHNQKSVDSIDPGSDDEMFEASDSSTGEVQRLFLMMITWMTMMMTSMTLIQMFQTGSSGARLFSLRGFWT